MCCPRFLRPAAALDGAGADEARQHRRRGGSAGSARLGDGREHPAEATVCGRVRSDARPPAGEARRRARASGRGSASATGRQPPPHWLVLPALVAVRGVIDGAIYNALATLRRIGAVYCGGPPHCQCGLPHCRSALENRRTFADSALPAIFANNIIPPTIGLSKSRPASMRYQGARKRDTALPLPAYRPWRSSGDRRR